MDIRSILKSEALPDVRELSSLSLAFVGDSVYEQYIRTKVLAQGNRPAYQLHNIAVGYVKAKAQAIAARGILSHLSEEESEILRRGRNTNIHTVPKHADMNDYRQATGLECLVGYLYVTGQTERMLELLDLCFSAINAANA